MKRCGWLDLLQPTAFLFPLMLYLVVVSLIWAFSFGLIKTSLAEVNSSFVAAARLGIALLAFLPFLRPRLIDRRTGLRLVLSGAVQYGGMYLAYLYAFRYLKAYEVALFTLLTPLYVTLIDDWLQRRVKWVSLLAVGLAILGAWVVQGSQPPSGVMTGFWIVQVSNLCFAFGQLDYRRLLDGQDIKDAQVFALPYLGGFLLAALAALVFTPWSTQVVTGEQWLTLFYLGAIASGLGFFLWNVGARKVDAGTLAIFNDLKIPLAVAVTVIFFGEQAAWVRLIAGGGLGIAALILNRWQPLGGDPAPVNASL